SGRVSPIGACAEPRFCNPWRENFRWGRFLQELWNGRRRRALQGYKPHGGEEKTGAAFSGRSAMQMPALLVAILLAGGNPVWDQQKPQMVCTDRAVVADAVPSGAKAPKLSVMPAC